ncbi:MAG: MarR family transcriptional regulator [Desulfuromonadales bacterium]|nr:MarR family transcriptional regulator [Desulfuromonadales bacterium]
MKENIGYLLRRASTVAMVELAKRLKALDLRPTEATVLLSIDANPNATPSELGRLLAIASANMAPLIARLEVRKLIEREPMDGRSHALSLTPDGLEIIKQIQRIVTEHETDLLDNIPVSARKAILTGLRAIWKDD